MKSVESLKVLVVGLGSMGKRRIRNLRALGVKNIVGYDSRPDRRKEAQDKYDITSLETVDTNTIQQYGFDAFVISVPPAIHHHYMELSVSLGIPFFVEASVVDHGLDNIIAAVNENNLVAAPSGTLYFHNGIRKIYEIVKSGELGKVTNVTYHSGQYLPDWHTYEKVSEYYVSQKETGGAREIVPFELTWITKLFGFPQNVVGSYLKTIEIEGAEEIEDTYNAILHYENGLLINLAIDVVSRYGTRKLLINGSKKQLRWSWEDQSIEVFNPDTNQWDSYKYDSIEAHEGYNKNITEQMYIDELGNFLNAALGKEKFFNDLEYDRNVLRLLYTIEQSWNEKRYIDYTTV
ncbi:Gfo/Idh/MocA family protein [Pontibacter lucknowensis]|uniref:Predicted dehydrogenase n=1 Tax=Pontibacter lucknowensis TaxID=1077936 RepID=A0A1N7ATB9_9BACT|nr:Gfo/Idh/MocA family oxidoreductase [Pontibacter lucknowensis]SIR42262.1 Predicted dehydrogenase [Pontibacter lucknowensis]